jgi:hypothetical protein
MVARAEAVAATGERILDAAVDVFWESLDHGLHRDPGAAGDLLQRDLVPHPARA